MLAEQCESFTARPERMDRSLVAELFALDDWVARADLLRAALVDLTPGLEQQTLTGLGDAFVVAATALRHFQADPLLPDELLPPGWPGPGFRADYERFDAAFKAAWATRFADQPDALHPPAPPTPFPMSGAGSPKVRPIVLLWQAERDGPRTDGRQLAEPRSIACSCDASSATSGMATPREAATVRGRS